MNFLKTVVSLGLGGSSCHGRPVVHPFFPAPSRLSSPCVYVVRLRRDKLRWLKQIKQHMALPRGRQIWVWFDVLSVPQRSRDLQIKAIGSLPSYTQLCTRCVSHPQRTNWACRFVFGQTA